MRTAALSLQHLREEAAARFEALGYPTPRMEAWRYTNVAPIARTEWKEAGVSKTFDAEAAYAGRATAELVFINGHLVQTKESAVRGLSVLPLRGAPQEAIDGVLGRIADFRDNAFVALNTANFRDGVVITVDSNVAVPEFVHILHVGEGDGVWSHPRTVVVANRASQVAVVETFVGRGRYFTNAVTEVVAREGAIVDHYKVQCESVDAFHVGSVSFRQERSSSVVSRNVSVGGALVRNDLTAALAGEGATLTLDGLFVATGSQHVDNHTLIDHLSPHCESHELYKGVLDQNGRGIFDGRIIVRPGAQKTVSRQENRNLLLSETAIADSKPTLEIHNDDVKCNHGSTIGQLEEEPMFYLRSRGIGEQDARNLLIYAFAGEIVDRMKIEPVRERVRRALFQQMPHRMPERRENAR